MSERFYNNSALALSSTMMTFNEYFTKFVRTDTNLANGWGWFVDIELNEEPTRVIHNRFNNSIFNKNKYRYNIHKISLPSTIKEYPSIRSMKSMTNLNDTSMIFEMDGDYNKKHRTNNYVMACTNIIGIITLALCYYVLYD
jgi:hypothetical protein